jgi:hypothetical protein
MATAPTEQNTNGCPEVNPKIHAVWEFLDVIQDVRGPRQVPHHRVEVGRRRVLPAQYLRTAHHVTGIDRVKPKFIGSGRLGENMRINRMSQILDVTEQ